MTEYKAVTIEDQEADSTSRPQCGLLVDGSLPHWLVIDPTNGVSTQYMLEEVRLLGEWTGPSVYRLSFGQEPVTWEAYAKHAAGNVLRQRNLVDRLAQAGITRFEHEDYVSRQSPFRTDLRLNYDELDSLLPPLDDMG